MAKTGGSPLGLGASSVSGRPRAHAAAPAALFDTFDFEGKGSITHDEAVRARGHGGWVGPPGVLRLPTSCNRPPAAPPPAAPCHVRTAQVMCLRTGSDVFFNVTGSGNSPSTQSMEGVVAKIYSEVRPAAP